ncbi:DNRLRE domain-containing protein, partial [Kribbella sp. NPDC020789]
MAHPPRAVSPQAVVPPAQKAAVGPLAPPFPAKVGKVSAGGKPERVREFEGRRTARSTSYEMSDGTTQVVLSTDPVHYKDAQGRWQQIDTKVVPGADGFENAKNSFRARFGKSSDRLLSFEADGASIRLGAVGDKRTLVPTAKDSAVTFADVFGTADVRYRVTSTGVKEDVVLTSVADVAGEYVFELEAKGLTARAQADGSIGFFKGEALKYVVPAPVMSDAGAGRSDKVTQTITEQGGKTLLTLRPDQSWLKASDRVFPVAIDPTIVVVPDPAAAQDTSISEAAPTTTYGSNSTVLVGDDANHNTWRGLLKFDTSMIPANTAIRSADLNMHYGSSFGADNTSVQFVALKATKDWSESTATWSGMNTSFDGTYPVNKVVVDDQETAATSYEGLWKDQSNASAVNGWFSYAPSGTTPDTFTWDARVPSAGDYLVQGHYFQATYRGKPTVTITGYPDPALNATWDQTVGSASGAWYS